MSMNKFMVTGRLTADPELRFTQDGTTPVVNFTLANNWCVRNEDGVTEQKTQYTAQMHIASLQHRIQK